LAESDEILRPFTNGSASANDLLEQVSVRCLFIQFFIINMCKDYVIEPGKLGEQKVIGYSPFFVAGKEYSEADYESVSDPTLSKLGYNPAEIGFVNQRLEQLTPTEQNVIRENLIRYYLERARRQLRGRPQGYQDIELIKTWQNQGLSYQELLIRILSENSGLSKDNISLISGAMENCGQKLTLFNFNLESILGCSP
jgi:hypothetical protein